MKLAKVKIRCYHCQNQPGN
uniref:Uncharacterized protein n=1 Tax=Romanomermis culicivorax TaxID=13658 RepID=A0A915JKM0_ROMCU